MVKFEVIILCSGRDNFFVLNKEVINPYVKSIVVRIDKLLDPNAVG